jgi:hypothetical protein
MKLSRVWLDFAFPHPLLEGPRYELSEDDVSSIGYGEMRYDPVSNSLVFGKNVEGINWSHVIRWQGSDLQLECPQCGGSFKSSQALGNHKHHCKGKKEKAA